MAPASRLPLACLALTWATVLVPAPGAQANVTGRQVRDAVRRGVTAIRARQDADGSWPDHHQPGGMTCLATLALLQAGQSPDSASVAPALEYIRRLPDQHVYTTSLKIMALATADQREYRREINLAAQWLIKAQNSTGLWSYQVGGNRFDHSNSQFALLGLHAAAQAGIRVPAGVWRRAEAKVLRTQNRDGGWTYQAKGPSYGSMTAAGVADLLILGHRLSRGRESGFHNGIAPNCGRYRNSKPLAAGLEWLARRFQAESNPGRGRAHVLYWLYAVERCGILSGRRFLGRHDWYREGARDLVRRQTPSGLWNMDLVDTCFAVLFLAKGHKSLLIQKLQWSEGDEWNPDRHDVAHLVAFVGDQLGEPVAWQTIPFDATLEEWLAAPILYMHGHTFPQWNVEQRDKVRAYVDQGGTLLAEACCGREEFGTGFERFAALAFPEVPLRELGPSHAVYRLLHKIEPYPGDTARPYALRGIDLGCRTAVIYSPRDFSCLWEQGDIPVLSDRAFRLGANIAAYAIGRRPLRDRLDAVVLPAAAEDETGPPTSDAFRLAQIVYEGDWRPFPAALSSLSEFLRDELDFDVQPRYRQVRLGEGELHTSPVLYLAGHYGFELSDRELAALASHLRRGGFLIADACCGTRPFDGAFRRMVERLFPDASLRRLPPDHAVFVGAPGFDVSTVSYSPDVRRAKPGLKSAELWGLEVDGRLVLVYSPYSLGCGLSGPAFDGCWGLASEDARRLTANIVLYALTH